MSDANLLVLADNAFDSGRLADGLAMLRQYNRSNTQDAASWHRQAIVEEQIGSASNAGLAHYKCVEIAPDNALGYLYAGYWLQTRKLEVAAASLYSLAQQLEPAILGLEQGPKVSEQLLSRSRAANLLMRRVLSQHHKNICAQHCNADRIRDAQWVQTHDQEIDFKLENFAPELFFIKDLETKPFFEPADLEWTSSITAKAALIKKELASVLSQQSSQDCVRPYLNEEFTQHKSLEKLAGSADWSALDIYREGELNKKVAHLLPETLSALDSLPTYSLDEKPFEVFFSFLKPHQEIASHYGQSNHALTVHLALDIPVDCYLKVDSQKRQWKEEELLIFDDSFSHSAHNESDFTRVVLIFSVWHPNLKNAEKTAIQHSFKARQDWLLKRESNIQALINS